MSDFALSQLRIAPAFRTALSAGTVPYGLSQEASLPASTLDAQIKLLVAAYDDVKARIDKYGVALNLDRAKAAQAKVELQAWANDHAGTIRTMNASATLPDAIAPKLPPALAYAWVCSLWSDASLGIDLYRYGVVQKCIAAGVSSAQTTQEEIADKKKMLEALTALDQEGHLAAIFEARKKGLSGFRGLGLEPATTTLLIALAIIAAIAGVILGAIVLLDRQSKYAAQHDDECKWARENDKTLVSLVCASTVDPVTVAIMVGGGVLLAMFLAQYTFPKYVSGTVDFLDDKFKDGWRLAMAQNTFGLAATTYNLPAPAATPPAIFSVPKAGGGFDYYQTPAGVAPGLGDNWPLPSIVHPNRIGISSLTVGRDLPPGSVKVGEGLEAKGSITPMPGAGGPLPGLDAEAAKAGFVSSDGVGGGGEPEEIVAVEVPGDAPTWLPAAAVGLFAGWLAYAWWSDRR